MNYLRLCIYEYENGIMTAREFKNRYMTCNFIENGVFMPVLVKAWRSYMITQPAIFRLFQKEANK